MPRELSLGEIFQLGYYWETKILLTAVTLGLFSVLDEKQGGTASEVANWLHLDERALTLLMNALVAMRILNKQEEHFANTEISKTYLVKSNKKYVGHLLALHDAEWSNWGQLEETIRTGQSPVRQHVFETNPEMGANVLAVLDRIGRESGPGLAKRLALDGVKRLLDVGGGAGTNAIAFCQEYPELTATVFDLPQTLSVARKAIHEVALEGRIALMAGNFLLDSFQDSYDIVLMSDILHYQDGKANEVLVKKVYGHLAEGGRLVIKDRFLDPSRTSPAWTTAFAVHILVNTNRGRCFTSQDAMGWLEEAGFQSVVELEPRAIVQGLKHVTGKEK